MCAFVGAERTGTVTRAAEAPPSRDVTQRKKLEAKIGEASAVLLKCVEYVYFMSYHLTVDGCSPRAARLL